jgi:formylglycine-generating enzyme required for sulfatase activity
MKTFHTLMTVVAMGVSFTQAEAAMPVEIETVAVGNPGNAGEQSRLPNADPTFYGAVAHDYRIGKYEVTAGQYTAFLSAVAATDPYGLYNVKMSTHVEGCKIERSGSPGSYTYTIALDWAHRPVNFVSWADAVRFVNWLHNGQPTGAQGLATTEDGSYFLNGTFENSDSQLENVVREPDATWVIPTENEWYKAAYHKNDGVTANYWNYPTSADNSVSHLLIDPDPGNHATFSGGTVGDWTIGAPYYRTEVGAHENSASPYGTYDQGGNVQEFNETVPEWDIRGIRGGSWFWGNILGVWDRPLDMHSSDQFSDLGFRVANLDVSTTTSLGDTPANVGRVRLDQNIPNPFNPTTTIRFTLPSRASVTLSIFDTTGRLVRTLVDGVEEPGTHSRTWDGHDNSGTSVRSGIYFYQVRANSHLESRRMLLLK